MKKTALCLMLCLCVVLLCSCGEKEEYPMVNAAPITTQSLFGSTDETPDEPDQVLLDWDNTDYDPSSEDGSGVWDDNLIDMDETTTPVPTVKAESAGATPIVIDPIDKPTPTPLPSLSFTYAVYNAPKLHLQFEAPAGWIVDDSENDTYILTNPDMNVDFAASVTIRVTQLSGNYSKNELKKEVQGMQSTVRSSVNFRYFDSSNTAERTFLGANGVYANYNGTLENGIQVAGRVHAVCVNKNLYTIHVSYPMGYRETYVSNVYDKIRHTIKITE